MNKQYKTRTVIIFLMFCVVFLIVLINLYCIQIKHHHFYTQLGEKQYKFVITTNPPRAPIYDRTGMHYLAMNKDSVSAFILPRVVKSKKQLETFLKKHFPSAYDRLQQIGPAHFMYVARRLTPQQIQLIKQHNIEDIQLLNEPGRFYPNITAAPIIGVTDIDNKGLFGLEFLFNKKLAGKATTRTLHKDARSGHYYFDRTTHTTGEQGVPVSISIDNDLQFLAFEQLQQAIDRYQAKEGSVLIMNPKNGEIIAMACAPSFDPNNTRNLDLTTTKNKIVAEAYELGSVLKVFGALACLEEGIVKPNDMIDCEQVKTTYIDGRKINTVPSSVAGIIPFTQVIEKSNNIGIAKVVKQLGNPLYNHYLRIGFGKKTGIEFPAEHDGFVNPPDAWSKQSIFSLSYGYEITATLLQLARAFSIIANGGYDIQPTLLLTNTVEKKGSKRLYSPETITTIKNILENTVNQGSAQRARIKGYRIMGKTGTANLLIDGQYCLTKNIYTFAGIVEKDDYQRVIVAFIKEVAQKGVYASTIAVPLFETIAEKTVIHDKII